MVELAGEEESTGEEAPDQRACRKCGCAHSHVRNTKVRGGGRVVRYRECRYCGHRFTTEETAIGG